MISSKSNASAYVILKGKRHIATVQVLYGRSGSLQVECRDFTNEEDPVQTTREGSNNVCGGYDKLAACLSRFIIDGHQLANHCGNRIKNAKGFPATFSRKGYRVANWDKSAHCYRDCYQLPGLEYLHDLGYTVITAI